MTLWYRYDNANLILTLYIQPGAKISQVTGLYGDALKIKLASPPIEGRANLALRHFIATKFKIPLRQVALILGEKSRRKIIKITDCATNPECIFLD